MRAAYLVNAGDYVTDGKRLLEVLVVEDDGVVVCEDVRETGGEAPATIVRLAATRFESRFGYPPEWRCVGHRQE